MGALEQVRSQLLHPCGVNGRIGPGPQPRGFHQLGGHHPGRGLLEQARAGEDRKTGAARAQVVALALIIEANVPQQPGEQRLVHSILVGRRIDRCGRDGDAQRLGQLAQLGEQILPFAYAQVVDEFGLAQPAEGR